jgi:hypothetical protein
MQMKQRKEMCLSVLSHRKAVNNNEHYKWRIVVRIMLRPIYSRGKNTSISCIGDQEGGWVPDSSVIRPPHTLRRGPLVGFAGAPNVQSAKICVFLQDGFRSSKWRRYFCVSVVRLGIQFTNNCGRRSNYQLPDRLPLLLASETDALKKSKSRPVFIFVQALAC